MKTQQFVEGWASSGYCSTGGNANVVSVASDATPQGLVSWAIGQLQQLNVLLTVIGTAAHGDVEHDPGELVGAIRHQLQQVESVLIGATTLLQMQTGEMKS